MILGKRSAPKLDLLALLPKRGIGAEVGVHLGDFSKSLLHWSRPRKLFLIDPWRFEAGDDYKNSWYGGPGHTAQELEDRYQSVHKRFSRYVNSGRVIILRQTSEAGLGTLEDASLDYVYIDGNHNYEFVKRDLELSLQKVRSGGYITGDDYRPDGWWKGGVKKAVDEFGWREKKVELLWIKGRQFVFQRR